MTCFCKVKKTCILDASSINELILLWVLMMIIQITKLKKNDIMTFKIYFLIKKTSFLKLLIGFEICWRKIDDLIWIIEWGDQLFFSRWMFECIWTFDQNNLPLSWIWSNFIFKRKLIKSKQIIARHTRFNLIC